MKKKVKAVTKKPVACVRGYRALTCTECGRPHGVVFLGTQKTGSLKNLKLDRDGLHGTYVCSSCSKERAA